MRVRAEAMSAAEPRPAGCSLIGCLHATLPGTTLTLASAHPTHPTTRTTFHPGGFLLGEVLGRAAGLPEPAVRTASLQVRPGPPASCLRQRLQLSAGIC